MLEISEIALLLFFLFVFFGIEKKSNSTEGEAIGVSKNQYRNIFHTYF